MDANTFPVRDRLAAGQPFFIVSGDFAADCGNGDYRFGISAERTAQALRALADAIEQKKVMLSDVKMESHARPDDFSVETLSITFAQRWKGG